MIPTIIIVKEVQTEIRGYSLLGREFELKEPRPRRVQVTTLDGMKIEDEHWVISKDEFMRVVPEANNLDYNAKEIYIPVYVAKISFRPEYIRKTKIF
jgi:hypothetical protein